MAASTLKNSFYNTTAMLVTPLFGLAILPYVTRILGVEAFGAATLALTVSGYFATLTSAGIPVYGVREVATRVGRPGERSALFRNLVLLNLAACLVGTLAYFLLVFLVPSFRANLFLYGIAGFNVLFGFANIEWYFQGCSNFRIISVRAILSRALALASIVVFVQATEDTTIYVIIMVLSVAFGNLLIFFLALKKELSGRFILDIKTHLKSLRYFFLNRVLASIYTYFDIIFLGIIAGSYHVGIYSVAIRLARVFLLIVTSVTSVIFPKVSEQISSQRDQDYEKTLNNVLCFLLLTAIPGTAVLFFSSGTIMSVFAGKEFSEGALTLKIVCLLLLVVSFSNFLGVHVLYPRGLEKVVTRSLAWGASLAVIANLLLIPTFQHNGAATATLLAEFSVLVYQIYFIGLKSDFALSIDAGRACKILLGLLLWFGASGIFYGLFYEERPVHLAAVFLFSFAVYVYVFYKIKEPIVLHLLSGLQRRST